MPRQFFVTDLLLSDSNKAEDIMRTLLRIAFFLLPLLPVLLSAQSPRTPVLVELFTSEGCSSCPPADRLLATLSAKQPVAEADIVVLEEHVDYWDNLGWRDRFSSSVFTARQNLYATRLRVEEPYTPQMVVDGTAQFVGNDPSKALTAITRAASNRKIPLNIDRANVSVRQISGSVSTPGTANLPQGDLYAALVDSAATTQVRAGENSGRRLDHVSVVRVLQRIGRSQDLANGPVRFTVAAPADSPVESMRLIVFAQLPSLGPVVGIATASVR
jgi:hypothetical protein